VKNFIRINVVVRTLVSQFLIRGLLFCT